MYPLRSRRVSHLSATFKLPIFEAKKWFEFDVEPAGGIVVDVTIAAKKLDGIKRNLSRLLGCVEDYTGAVLEYLFHFFTLL